MTGNEFIEDLFFLFKIKQNEDTLKYTWSSQGIKLKEVDRVLQLFDEIENVAENKFTIYHNNNEGKEVAEVAVSIDFYKYRRLADEEFYKKIEDNDNQIEYEIGGEATDYYIVWIYKKMFEKYPTNMKTEVRQKIHRVLGTRGKVRYRRELNDGDKEISLLSIMRRAVDCITLKVTKQKESKINLDEAIESFSYTYMCNMNSPIKMYSLEEIIGILNRRQKEKNIDFAAPKRKYNSNLIDYYNLAISSEDPFISFISYYHIIEYYFDEVYREQQINTLRTSITSPRFSYKDDKQLFNIIEKIIKDNRFVRENGSGNEQQSLNYVLNKYIHDLDDFKQRLNNEELNFYQNKSVSFSKGDVINWDKDKDKILKAISNRIYKTRNALIHSKSSKKDVTYHPYLHRNELEKEISLIKIVAEYIIENDAVYLM
ncbi:methylamine utilization protein MauJ [Priestia endophytica]|uniref:methylamine utilization protein MauJ n=1 Tax=Priestia endophytica TaxID=135735 RepID=UPI0018CCBC0F|nr:methylamine utilization protein MauJ [Priestia endophytica]